MRARWSKMSMKIAFVNARYAPNEFGGAERTVRTIAETHVAHGHEACAISVAHDKSQREGELNGVRTRYVPLTHVYEPWKERPGLLKRALFQAVDSYHPLMGARVGRILDEEKPDLVQCGNLRDFSVAVWVEAKKRGLPVVQMLHDYYLGCVNSSMFRGGEELRDTMCALSGALRAAAGPLEHPTRCHFAQRAHARETRGLWPLRRGPSQTGDLRDQQSKCGRRSSRTEREGGPRGRVPRAH